MKPKFIDSCTRLYRDESKKIHQNIFIFHKKYGNHSAKANIGNAYSIKKLVEMLAVTKKVVKIEMEFEDITVSVDEDVYNELRNIFRSYGFAKN
jgi:hypothetical protein